MTDTPDRPVCCMVTIFEQGGIVTKNCVKNIYNMDQELLLKRLKQISLYIRMTSWNGMACFSKATLASGKSTSDVILIIVIISEYSNILNE